MTRALFDTNVILDIALKRNPHYSNAVRLVNLIDKNSIQAFITATTVTDIYYIVKKDIGHDFALEFLNDLINFLDVIGVTHEVILKALKSEIKDFEDAIQSTAADFNEIEVIITRNKQDFVKSRLQVFTPSEFLELQK